MPTLEDIGKNFKDFTPSDNDGVNRIIQNWGNELIKQLQNNLLKNKSNASSSLSQSITPEITQPATGYNLSIMMQDYWFYVENGRKPTQGGGNGQLYKNIYEWIQNKADIQSKIISKSPDRIAATKSLAYVITRKIHREGTKAKPFVSPALKQVTTQTLATRISEYIVESLTGN
jgi:hypothetical protein